MKDIIEKTTRREWYLIGFKDGEQETAEKIFKKLEYYYHFMSDTIMIPKELFNKFAKEYGVEVE